MKRQPSFFMLLILCANIAWGQTRTLSGRVISDNTKQSLSGVIVSIKGSQSGTSTASSSSISFKDLKDNPLNNAAEVLQGRLANVQVTLSEGTPGADAVINICGRGSITRSGDPLYVVDDIHENLFLNKQPLGSSCSQEELTKVRERRFVPRKE